MASAERIDDDQRLPRGRDVPGGMIGYLELVAAAVTDSEVCASAPIGDDAGYGTARLGADEAQPKA